MSNDAPVLAAGEQPRAPAHPVSPGYRTYALVILTLVYVVNYLDRQILSILLPQIQEEFLLSDTQLGFLSGTAFAVVYAVLGVPLAVLADRVNRRNLVAVSLTLFSLMTVLCGFVTQFWHLLAARFGTGIGEAGTGPSINSMISDLYPPEKRASALSFYSAGLNIGLLIGFFGGGWIAQEYGWRHAFLAAGAPGLVLAFVVMFTVREPVRGQADAMADIEKAPAVLSVVKYMWARKSMRWLCMAAALASFGGYANLFFIPKFLIVSHGLTIVEVSITLALLTGIPGAIGTYMAGVYADRFGKKDVRWYFYVPILGALISLPFGPVFYLANNTTLALAAAVIPVIMGATYLGPTLAVTQGLVPLRMRAQSIAILLFVLTMIGLGLGPVTIGAISDVLKPHVGTDSLRYALMFGMVTNLAGAWCYWRGARWLRQDWEGPRR